jgi:hypothetical protein
MITVEEVRSYALSLPQSREVEHWGKPSFRINNKVYAVLQEDGVTLTVKTVGEDKMIYTTMDPATFQIPETFSKLNYMHINLTKVDVQELQGLLLKAWSSVVPKKILKEYMDGLC